MRNSNLWGGPGFLNQLKGSSPLSNIQDDDICMVIRGASPQSGSGILYPIVTKRGIQQYQISGVTRDASSNALAGCRVELFTTVDDVPRATQISDAGGNYSFLVPSNGYQYYIVAYLPGSPDRAGTTVNTLIGQ